jgi:cobalamin biosynthesis protein CobD/CbiB
MSSYRHVPHPHILRRKAARPVKVADQFSRASPVTRFNTAFALKITAAVGSMWCAYIFAAITLVGLPSAIHDGVGGIIQWIAQTFLQLVLLSIIIVGQNVQASASDARAEDTYQDAEAVLHEALQIQEHLLTQDRELERLIAALGTRPPGP